MKLELLIRKLKDNIHRGGYYLEKYIINDGKKHAVIICPGGAYRFVASFVEGMPYARWLNKRGYSAFVVHYACGKNAGYPAPQRDVARANQGDSRTQRGVESGHGGLLSLGRIRRWSSGSLLWYHVYGISAL